MAVCTSSPVGQVEVRCYYRNRVTAPVVNQFIARSVLAEKAVAVGDGDSLVVRASGLFFDGDACDVLIDEVNSNDSYGLVRSEGSQFDLRELIKMERENHLDCEELDEPSTTPERRVAIAAETEYRSQRIDELKHLLSRPS